MSECRLIDVAPAATLICAVALPLRRIASLVATAGPDDVASSPPRVNPRGGGRGPTAIRLGPIRSGDPDRSSGLHKCCATLSRSGGNAGLSLDTGNVETLRYREIGVIRR